MSHEAAILNSKGSPLVVSTRPTAAPGKEEVVIAVTFVALNPVDHIQQTMGFNISSFPYILGFDVSGTIIAVGSSVSGRYYYLYPSLHPSSTNLLAPYLFLLLKTGLLHIPISTILNFSYCCHSPCFFPIQVWTITIPISTILTFSKCFFPVQVWLLVIVYSPMPAVGSPKTWITVPFNNTLLYQRLQ